MVSEAQTGAARGFGLLGLVRQVEALVGDYRELAKLLQGL